MSVFKRNNTGNYYIQFNLKGRTYIKSSKTTNKRSAERMEKEWKDQLHRIEFLGERPRIKLADALAGYKDQRKNTGSEKYSHANASQVFNHFDTNMYVDEIETRHLNQFKSVREKQGISAATIKHNFQAIKSAIDWANDNGYVTKQLQFPKLKVANNRLRYLTVEEEKRLLQQLDPKRDIPYRPKYDDRPADENNKRQDMYDLVVLLLDTGARYGEIANIGWDRIDLPNRMINLWRPKVRNESIIYMTSRVYEILTRRWSAKQGDHVLCNSSGGPRGYASKGIRLAIKNAGLRDFTIHDLRHTCASRLIQNGLSLYETAQILGHTQISTTQRYAHLSHVDVSRKARDIIEAVGRA
jgi:integrase